MLVMSNRFNNLWVCIMVDLSFLIYWQDISELKQQGSNLQQDIKALSDKMDNGFANTRSELVDAIEAVGQRVDKLEHSINDVETVTAQLI